MPTPPKKIRVKVVNADRDLRLDQFLAARIPELSRRKARVLLDIGGVFVDRARVKVAGRKVKVGQVVEVTLGGAFERAGGEVGRRAREREENKLPAHRIEFEDEHLMVVFKPSGLLTAPTPESDRGNLASVLSRDEEGNPRAVHVVHRLDLQTSGLLVFAKSRLANRRLAEQFQFHTIERQYRVVVMGRFPEDELVVRLPVTNRRAVTHFSVDERFGDVATALRARLETGRTHQIRLHVQHLGCPVFADPQYGHPSERDPPRMALHAEHLGFVHPATDEPLHFECPWPEVMLGWIQVLRDECESK